MRPSFELLDFLKQEMSMQAIYQPVVILHLLTRDGWAMRSNLAQTLSGYDAAGTATFWISQPSNQQNLKPGIVYCLAKI